MTDVKICGITEEAALQTAIEAGVAYIGFVFYPDSPRAISPEEAEKLRTLLPAHMQSVGLFVDPSDAVLEQALSVCLVDIIQLHGEESPARVSDIKSKTGKPVMKAIAVREESDLDPVASYEAVCDWLLFDTRVDGMVGGTGKSFDWTLLVNRNMTRPWMLSGGLTPENVGEALKILTPDSVDISSGVELKRGKKDPAKIRGFIKAVKSVC